MRSPRRALVLLVAAITAIALLSIPAVLILGRTEPSVAPPAAPEPPAPPSSGPRAKWVVRTGADLPLPAVVDEGAAAAAAHDALPKVALGCSPVGEQLPLCGRRGPVAFRRAPGGGPLEELLISCDSMGEIAPHAERIEVREQQGDWLGTGKGWLSTREVRTVEYLVVEGREYWHDLLESEIDTFDGRFVILKGELDPCAGVACGTGDQGTSRKGEERMIELTSPPAQGRAGVKVVSGSYLCCT